MVVRPRLVAEVARIIVGLFGLVHAQVRYEEEDRIAVDADEDEVQSGKVARDYLTGSFTLATLFPHAKVLDLQIFRAGTLKFRIQTPISDVISHDQVPKHAAAYSIIRLCYLSSIEGDDRSEPERIVREIIRPGSRLLTQDLIETVALRERLPKTRNEYTVSLEELTEKVMVLSTGLKALSIPPAAVGPRNSLLAGLDALARGLAHQRQLAKLGRWDVIKRPNTQLQRGEAILGRWR